MPQSLCPAYRMKNEGPQSLLRKIRCPEHNAALPGATPKAAKKRIVVGKCAFFGTLPNRQGLHCSAGSGSARRQIGRQETSIRIVSGGPNSSTALP